MSQQNKKVFRFVVQRGVKQMGKKTRLIRIPEEHWHDVEPFMQKPIIVTFEEVLES
jgi:hypothetical protein